MADQINSLEELKGAVTENIGGVAAAAESEISQIGRAHV